MNGIGWAMMCGDLCGNVYISALFFCLLFRTASLQKPCRIASMVSDEQDEDSLAWGPIIDEDKSALARDAAIKDM